jgi:hypothetical protein
MVSSSLLHFMVLSPMICWQHQCDMGGNKPYPEANILKFK